MPKYTGVISRAKQLWAWLQDDPEVDYRFSANVVSVARISIVGFLAVFFLWVRGPSFLAAMVAILVAAGYQVAWWWWYVRRGHEITKRVAVAAITADVLVTGVGVMFSGGTRSPALLVWAVTLSLSGVWIGVRATLPALAAVLVFLAGAGLGPLDMHVDPNIGPLGRGVFAAYMLAFLMVHGGMASAAQKANARALAAAEELARRDPLTGLGNRMSFDDAVQEMVAHAELANESLSLAVIDVDNFKAVNDTYGHIAGDGVLIALARQIRSEVRQTDLAVRLGGEEFVVLLANTNEAAAAIVIERIRTRFAALDEARGTTFSAGIASADRHLDAQALLAAADDALYRAKRTGKDRVVLDGKNPTAIGDP